MVLVNRLGDYAGYHLRMAIAAPFVGDAFALGLSKFIAGLFNFAMLALVGGLHVFFCVRFLLR